MENIAYNLYAQFNDDRLWNEKALVLTTITRSRRTTTTTLLAIGEPFLDPKKSNLEFLVPCCWYDVRNYSRNSLHDPKQFGVRVKSPSVERRPTTPHSKFTSTCAAARAATLKRVSELNGEVKVGWIVPLHSGIHGEWVYIHTWWRGRPTMEGKTARGASSPAKPALHMPEPLSITSADTSSSMVWRLQTTLNSSIQVTSFESQSVYTLKLHHYLLLHKICGITKVLR